MAHHVSPIDIRRSSPTMADAQLALNDRASIRTTPSAALLERLAGLADISVATLGPDGTSSSYAARHWLARINRPGTPHLHESYEAAAAEVIAGHRSFLLVANAYGQINHFYLGDDLIAVDVFPLRTPAYGLAVHPDGPGTAGEDQIRIVTHPAPAHLAPRQMGPQARAPEIVFTSSTARAAELVAARAFPVCITTDLARRHNGLAFVSQPQRLRMVWTVFARLDHPTALCLFGADRD